MLPDPILNLVVSFFVCSLELAFGREPLIILIALVSGWVVCGVVVLVIIIVLLLLLFLFLLSFCLVLAMDLVYVYLQMTLKNVFITSTTRYHVIHIYMLVQIRVGREICTTVVTGIVHGVVGCPAVGMKSFQCCKTPVALSALVDIFVVFTGMID